MLWLKWLHILFAMTGVGINLSFLIWRRGEPSLPILKGILFVDRFANFSYTFALITGIGLTQMMGIAFSTPWVAGALILFVVMAGVGGAVATPALRKVIAALEANNPDFPALYQRERTVRFVLAMGGVLLVWLMVLKPQA